MKKRILFCFACLFVLSSNVNGATVGTQKLCDTSNKCGKGKASENITIGDEKTCRTDLSSDSGYCSVNDNYEVTVPVPNPKPANYDVIFLVDTSRSVINNDRISALNKSIDAGIKVLKQKTEKSKYKVCKFSDEVKCFTDGWQDVSKYNSKNFINKGNGYWDNTDTEKALTSAESKFLSSSKNIPMIILITDGYPTVSTDLGTKSKLKMHQLSTARYFYQTMVKMKQIKDSNPKLKIITIGIMESYDVLAKYFLNPSLKNWNNLPTEDNYTTNTRSEGYNLRRMLAGKDATIYDAVAGKKTVPDQGLFYGKVDKKNKKITYSIEKDWYNKHTEIRAYVPSSDDNVIGDVSAKCGSKPLKISINKDTSSGYAYVDITTKDNASGCSAVNVVVKLKKTDPRYINKYTESSKIKYDFTDFSDKNDANKSIVDGSYVGYEDVSKNLSNILGDIVDDDSEEVKDSYVVGTNYYYGACKEKNIIGKKGYYKGEATGQDEEGNTIPLEVTFSFNVNIPITITESANFKFGTLDDMIYAGGGYNWTGTNINNTVNWDYSMLSTKGIPIIKYSNMSKEYNRPIDGITIISDATLPDVLDITEVCIDSKCSSHYSVNDLYDTVNDKFSVSNNSSEYDGGVFKTVDSNDETKLKDPVNHNVKYTTNVTRRNNSVGFSQKSDYSLSLYGACIDPNDGIVTYSNDGTCGDSSRNGGKLRYVPLKYPESPAYIYANTDISSYGELHINVKSTCSIDVKQVLYEEDDDGGGKLKISYKYRSIDVDNPFPKSVNGDYEIPQNWALWYAVKDNQSRMSGSYNNYPNNPLYSITLNDDNISSIKNITTSYTDWNNIDLNGAWKSSAWENQLGFNNTRSGGSYCELGRFNESCDEVR